MAYSLEEYGKLCRLSPDDKPDVYGFTKKMHLIYDLVESGKKLEDGGFDIGDADREFYDNFKAQYDWTIKKRGGRPYHFPRYVSDIDPW